jgi:LDH2 family malate/lactate/ureidoglycolate dehydrogenase
MGTHDVKQPAWRLLYAPSEATTGLKTIDHLALRRLTAKLLRAAGAPQKTSEFVADMLVGSNLYGVDSHGVIRIPEYIRYIDDGKVLPRAKPRVTKDRRVTATMDGMKAFGQVTAAVAMKKAITKARVYGVGIVTCFNTTHVGRLADYPLMAVDVDMIGMLYVKAPVIVAPWGGRRRLLGTNPISFAIPAGREDPIVADFATSASSEGKIRIKRNHGEILPPNWVIDKEGNPSVNADDFYNGGALLPFGGFKGYAISLLAEALGGAMTGQGISDEFTSINGLYVQVINVGHFVPIKSFKQSIDRLIRKMRNSPPAKGFDRVMLPGEPEEETRKQRIRTGIPLDDNVWNGITEAAAKFGIAI